MSEQDGAILSATQVAALQARAVRWHLASVTYPQETADLIGHELIALCAAHEVLRVALARQTAALEALRTIQTERDEALAERDRALVERDQAHPSAAALRRERDAHRLRADGYAKLCTAYRIGGGPKSNRLADAALTMIDKAEKRLADAALQGGEAE